MPPTGKKITRVVEAARRQRAVDMDLKLLLEFIVYGGVSRRLGVLGFIREMQSIGYYADHILDLFGLLGIDGLLSDNLCLNRS